MKSSRIIQLTEDGSHTIHIPSLPAAYHSRHGAIQESMHVFIETGLRYFINQHKCNTTINIFEIGFGTGLNALLSLQEANHFNQNFFYQTIETEPLSANETAALNYTTFINKNLQEFFFIMHDCAWNKVIVLNNLFSFQKIKISLQQFEATQNFHVIYFDAFDPNTQPELWTQPVFNKMFNMLYPQGILVTYCSKGIVQRAMRAAGFKVEKIKGPPGKREIIRAIKPTPY